jgi:NAD(P)H dehydrogenase (quinone)
MNVLLILGHPKSTSFSNALLEQYAKGAEAAHVRILRLGDLEFNPLSQGYGVTMPLEPDLVAAQQQILWADHLMFVYPTWWGVMPALLKGFLDRTLTPGFAFKFNKNSVVRWDRLLSGRTARVITTIDAPSWYHTLFMKAPGLNAMKRSTLEFCGITPVKTTILGSVKGSSLAQRQKWLNLTHALGRQDVQVLGKRRARLTT